MPMVAANSNYFGYFYQDVRYHIIKYKRFGIIFFICRIQNMDEIRFIILLKLIRYYIFIII